MATTQEVTRQNEDTPLLDVPKEPEQRWRRVFPEIPTFLYFMALVAQFPVQQFWLMDHFAHQNGLDITNQDSCANTTSTTDASDLHDKVHALTSEYFMLIGLVSNVLAIVPTLCLGPLTDKFGRKFVFFYSFGLLTVYDAVLFCVFLFNWSPNVLLVNSLVLGSSGSFGLYLTAAFSMVADISSTKRTLRVATLEMAIATGCSVGLALVGVWVKNLGYAGAMGVSLGLIATAFIYFVFFIPETYTSPPQNSSWHTNLTKCVKLFVKNSQGRKIILFICLLAFLVFTWCRGAEESFLALHLYHHPFCWNKLSVTLFTGGEVLAKWIIILVLVYVLKGRVPESVLALTGAISGVISYLLKGLATTNPLFIVGTVTGLLTDMVPPMSRSMMSKQVSENDQGALFAGIGVLQILTEASTGVSMSSIYIAGLGHFLGLPYMVLSGLCFLSASILTALVIHKRRHPRDTQLLPSTEEECTIN